MSNPAQLSWRLHGLLLALVLLQLGVWRLGHRSSAELADAWATGSPREQLDAAHVLLNRGPTPGASFDPEDVGSLLDWRNGGQVGSIVFSSDYCKLGRPVRQLQAVVDGLESGRPGALVDFILQCRKVGGVAVGASSAMHRAELDWYYLARETPSWPPEVAREIDEHLTPWVDAIRAHLRED